MYCLFPRIRNPLSLAWSPMSLLFDVSGRRIMNCRKHNIVANVISPFGTLANLRNVIFSE